MEATAAKSRGSVRSPTAPGLGANDAVAPAAGRHDGIDAFRLVAFLGVVVIHAQDFATFGATASQLCRFSVPFFFVASGYYLTPNCSPLSLVFSKSLRLVPIYAFWLAAYLLLFGGWPDSLGQQVVFLMRGGAGHHLWFLPSLGVCIAAYALVRPLGFKALWIFASAFYVFGVAFGSYHTLLGLPELWDVRDGLTFGFIFIVAGAQIRALGLEPRPAIAWLAFFGILMMHYVEQTTIPTSNRQDFFLLTLPLGVSAFLAAMSARPQLPPIFRRIASHTLGMYAVHLMFILWLSQFVSSGPWQWAIVVALTAIASATVATLSGRLSFLKAVVK